MAMQVRVTGQYQAPPQHTQGTTMYMAASAPQAGYASQVTTSFRAPLPVATVPQVFQTTSIASARTLPVQTQVAAPYRPLMLPQQQQQQQLQQAPQQPQAQFTRTIPMPSHPQIRPIQSQQPVPLQFQQVSPMRTIQPQQYSVAPAQYVRQQSMTTSVTPTTTPNVMAGPGYTQGAFEAKHQDDPQLKNLKELRSTSGLSQINVADALQLMQRAGGEDGKLSRDQFLVAYQQIMSSKGIPMPPDQVQHAVFDLFDRDDNQVVDLMEIVCGISLLCEGSEDEKIQAVFQVFDLNGDGVITMDEMYKFLTSVFKVVLTPNVIAVMNSMGVKVDSAEDLASVTALECFKTADLNHDNKLSIEEFKKWFYEPRNDLSSQFSPVRKLLQ